MSFWRDVKRGWNVGSRTAGKAVRGLGEKLGLDDGSAESAERRAALAEVDAWHRPAAPSPRAAPAAAASASQGGSPQSEAPSRALPPTTAPPTPPSPRSPADDLSEAEIEERIRRRTL